MKTFGSILLTNIFQHDKCLTKRKKTRKQSPHETGKKKKIQELGRLTLSLAGTETALKAIRRNCCVESMLLSSAQQNPMEGVVYFRGGNVSSFTEP